MATISQEIESLLKLGQSMGLKGDALTKFISDERERERQERERERQERRDEREDRLKQREMEKEAKEAEIKAREIEMEAKEKEAQFAKQKEELEMEKIDMLMKLEQMKKENESGSDGHHSGSSTPVTHSKAKAPKLPAFQDGKDNMDSYLLRFERYATIQGWDKDTEWAVNLSTLLTGRALLVYSSLDDMDADDYDILKEAILKRYALTEEGFRVKFRNAKPEGSESPSQYVTRMWNYLNRWIELSGTKKEYGDVIDLLLREQFLKSVSKDLAIFLKIRKPHDVSEMARIAEQYTEAHGGWQSFKGNRSGRNQFQGSRNDSSEQTSQKDRSSFQRDRPGGQTGQKDRFDGVKRERTCFICGRPGHIAKDCRKRHQKSASAACAPVDSFPDSKTGNGQLNSNTRSETVACMVHVQDKVSQVEVSEDQSLTKLQCGHPLPILSAACSGNTPNLDALPIKKGFVNDMKIDVMRDSGCTGAVVKRSLVPKEDMTGYNRTCYLIDRTVRVFPLARIDIKTPWYTGTVLAMVTPTPICDLVLGSIPGARDPEDPDPSWSDDDSEEVYVDKQVQVEGDDGVDGQSVETGNAVETRSQAKNKCKPFKGLKVMELDGDVVTVEKLKLAQENDPSLKRCRELADSQEEIVGKNGCKHRFLVSKGILYRQFQAPNVEHGDVIRQVVVPHDFRNQVMKLAHEAVFGGHQGSSKTKDKVLSNFYWPGVQSDIRRFCYSCDICQRTVPKGRVTRVPLGNMPLIDVPFDRVAIDLVGPIHPCSDRGHRYILVLMDYATRYPEAVPLKSIEAERIAEELVVMFSRLGIPREILTDLGSQFTSGIMKEVSRLLSIKQLVTTPYHPACNGLVERFNASLKSILKKICEEKPKDWDRYVAPILFAYREAPHDSTGFSPFELLYGRTVRGPMTILRELWTGEVETTETKSTYQYVIDLKDRLEETCKVAKAELSKSKTRYKKNYDRHARVRKFSVGDEVLLLLPTDNNKLLMHWKGPFPVVQKVGLMDYKIDLGHCQKTFHANLLKLYHRRDVASVCSIQCEHVISDIVVEHSSCDEKFEASVLEVACTAVIEEEPEELDEVREDPLVLKPLSNEELLHLPPLVAKETLDDVKINSDLDDSQKHEVKRILGNYKDVLTDLPGKTNLGEHEIKLTDNEPVRKKPYPIPHALRNKVKEEVQSMLNMGIIEKSNSPYASPLVMVKKPDGTDRYCVDMRLVNQKTVFDTEPIADQEEIFAKLATDHYFTKIDLSKGYWQIPMAKESKPITTFITHDGTYQFKMMPFGLVNAAATFSRIMRILLQGLSSVDNYIDDILIHTKSWEEHVVKLKEVLRRLRKANLTARPSKCFVGFEEVEFLGHIVGHGCIKPKQDKIESVQNAERPITKKQLRSFLGLIGFYRKYIPNFAAVACPLTDLTKKHLPNKIEWGESQELAFRALKNKLSSSPILRLPVLCKQFILRTDASDTGVGAVLLQDFHGEKFPIAYASKKLSKCQRKYSVIERECLAVIWAIHKFEPYLYGREFLLETDHQPLSCIKRSKVANGRIMRWALALQPFRFRVVAIKGSENVGADYMSRSIS